MKKLIFILFAASLYAQQPVVRYNAATYGSWPVNILQFVSNIQPTCNSSVRGALYFTFDNAITNDTPQYCGYTAGVLQWNSFNGNTGFANITAGTNTKALVMGTGGSLTVSGSGIINATQLNGSSIPLSQTCIGTNSSGQIVAGTCTFPGAGIPNSNGTSWNVSYGVTGTGASVVLATSPTLTTPNLGTPSTLLLDNATHLSQALDANFSNVQGTLLYRGASAWSTLAPGTSGNCLQTLGTGFNIQWGGCGGGSSPGGSNNAVQYNSSGSFGGVSLTANQLLIGTAGVPTGSSLTSLIDTVFGSTQGSILYRSGSAWTVLAPGTSGLFLKTQGSGANPVWAAGAGGGTVLNPTGQGASAYGAGTVTLYTNYIPRLVTGTTDAPTIADCSNTINYTNNSQVAITVPATGTMITNQTDGCPLRFIAKGTGGLSLTVTGGASIGGKTTYVLPGGTPDHPSTLVIGNNGSNYDVIAFSYSGGGYTVSTLPGGGGGVCPAGLKGVPGYYVTDASSPTYNGTLTGSAGTVVPVFCDGSVWTSH